jgi:hypothetical protein
MRRITLIAGLGLSLWPIAFLGWVFLVPHGDSAGGETASTTATSATTASTTTANATTTTSKKKGDNWKGRSIGGSDNETGAGGSSSSGGSSQQDGYTCIGYSATQARSLKRSINRIDRELRSIKAKADAGTASQSEINYFNSQVSTFNEKVTSYNRFLKRECIEN